ncbi:hypothetical protein [Bradyrhizobium sp. USDA 3458]|uniref:hypothetical protein n=1 Tax=Bradyrhizobium sp. USDA 3458 TaxID=2591461 RepID=UPI0011432ABA|nr:hypothetical protein [Bradyrhizobium sp. USDA 3458]
MASIPAEWSAVLAHLANLFPLVGMHMMRTSGLNAKPQLSFVLILGFYTYFIVTYFWELLFKAQIHYGQLASATLIYATYLFIVLSEILQIRLAQRLTEWRGEKWAKEMDYVYLILGAIGLALSTNRLSVVDDKLAIPEVVGPFIIGTALVVRGLKTRVEINEWNELPKRTTD